MSGPEGYRVDDSIKEISLESKQFAGILSRVAYVMSKDKCDYRGLDSVRLYVARAGGNFAVGASAGVDYSTK